MLPATTALIQHNITREAQACALASARHEVYSRVQIMRRVVDAMRRYISGRHRRSTYRAKRRMRRYR